MPYLSFWFLTEWSVQLLIVKWLLSLFRRPISQRFGAFSNDQHFFSLCLGFKLACQQYFKKSQLLLLYYSIFADSASFSGFPDSVSGQHRIGVASQDWSVVQSHRQRRHHIWVLFAAACAPSGPPFFSALVVSSPTLTSKQTCQRPICGINLLMWWSQNI